LAVVVLLARTPVCPVVDQVKLPVLLNPVGCKSPAAIPPALFNLARMLFRLSPPTIGPMIRSKNKRKIAK